RWAGGNLSEKQHRPLSPKLVDRTGSSQVVEGLLERHLDAQIPRIAFSPAEEHAQLTSQCAASPLGVERGLPGFDAERPRRLGIEYLFDLLELDEVVARPNR